MSHNIDYKIENNANPIQCYGIGIHIIVYVDYCFLSTTESAMPIPTYDLVSTYLYTQNSCDLLMLTSRTISNDHLISLFSAHTAHALQAIAISAIKTCT